MFYMTHIRWIIKWWDNFKHISDLDYSDNNEIHLTISFWTSAEIFNETHLIDDQRISEFELHNEALGHRFCKIFVISIQFNPPEIRRRIIWCNIRWFNHQFNRKWEKNDCVRAYVSCPNYYNNTGNIVF